MQNSAFSLLTLSLTGLTVLGTAYSSSAAIIDFTGGEVHLLNGTIVQTTEGVDQFADVDFYIEDGFKLDFIGGSSNPFSYHIGDYYGPGNDVIHAHWETGNYGETSEIRVSRVDGEAFDLNYFTLTSNTDRGGGWASGNEQAYTNSSNGYSQLLPSNDWGFSDPSAQIFLDNNFDNIDWFSFTVGNAVDCFGMDNFYIDEEFPSTPEPSSLLALMAVGGLFTAGLLRKKNA